MEELPENSYFTSEKKIRFFYKQLVYKQLNWI